MINNYISNRLFRIKLEYEYSELQEVKACVPQGSVLRVNTVSVVHQWHTKLKDCEREFQNLDTGMK